MVDRSSLTDRLRSASVPIYAGAGLRQYVVNSVADPLCQEAADEIEALRFFCALLMACAENAYQRGAEDAAGPSPYCEICGSCGSEGCGCEHKCKYAHEHPDVVRDIEALEARAEKAEASLVEALQTISGLIHGLPSLLATGDLVDEEGLISRASDVHSRLLEDETDTLSRGSET